jgi:hypothetical protein
MDGFFIGGKGVVASPSVTKQVAAILWGKTFSTLMGLGF